MKWKQNIPRYQAFLQRQRTDRPLLACSVGYFVSDIYPTVMAEVNDGLIKPEDIRLDSFLADCERLYEIYNEIDADFPYCASPFFGIPWMEAIMGCQIKSSPTSFWAEACVDDWETWYWQRSTLDNPWTEKLLELTKALVNHSAGRYQVAVTLMRGPSDILAAMRGAGQLPIDLFDRPEVMARAAKMCADAFIEVAAAQHNLLPDSPDGYFGGATGEIVWTPDKVIWLQEDAVGILSPQLYRSFFLPVDKYIADAFPYCAFHLHGTTLWAVDELLDIPQIDVIQLGLEGDQPEVVEEIFKAFEKVLTKKPLVLTQSYDDGLWSHLERELTEMTPNGLTIQVQVPDVHAGKRVKRSFFEILTRAR